MDFTIGSLLSAGNRSRCLIVGIFTKFDAKSKKEKLTTILKKLKRKFADAKAQYVTTDVTGF